MVDELKVTGAWARPTPAESTVAAVYMQISSPVDDELIEISTSRAERVSLHTYVESGSEGSGDGHMGHHQAGGSGPMAMVETDLVLEANTTVEFAPGGMHVMLEGLERPLAEGDSFELVLAFRVAGELIAPVEVSTNEPD